jgi:glycosyltransferase involved in cell wall biosynthesis
LYRERIAYLRKADICLAISESSKQAAIDHLGMQPNRVVNVGAGVDSRFCPLSIGTSTKEAFLNRFGLCKPFVMCSGTADERKNHLRLIKAFSLLPSQLRQGFQLAVVGKLPYTRQKTFEAQIIACGLTLEDVVILGGVTDLELHYLYNLCHLFIVPSWHEGFAFPALDALACGAPVVGSNTASLPEVIGRPDALFDPFNERAIMTKMSDVLTNEAFRELLKRHSLDQAARFSWSRSAEISLAKFETWYAERKSRPGDTETARIVSSPPEALFNRIAELSSLDVSVRDWAKTARAIAQNHPRSTARQLFVDVSEFAQQDAASGIQRVVRAVLSDLLANPPDGFRVIPVVAAAGAFGYRDAINFTQRFLRLPYTSSKEQFIEPCNGDVFLLGLDLVHAAIDQAEYLQSLRDLGVKIYFAIYDLIPITMPWAYPSESNISSMHLKWLDLIQQHDGAICISRSVADEFIQWIEAFGMKRLRRFSVGFFHLGANISGSVPTQGLGAETLAVLEALAKRVTFLSVGTIEPRKGQIQIIQAFDLLWAEGIDVNLVLVGKKGWGGSEWKLHGMTETLDSHRKHEDRFFWLEDTSDEYLEKIYEHSDCLLAASVTEGFGLPLVEAAYHGLSIIARDIPVFREVAGESALYFAGSKPESLAAQIQNWLALKAAGNAPSSSGISWSTWKQSTRRLLDVMLNDHWYYRWTSGSEERFRATDMRFGTVVGDRQDREVVSTGREGCLLHGPCIALEAGQYIVKVRGRLFDLSSVNAHAEVIVHNGNLTLAEGDVQRPDSLLSATLVSLVVSVPEKCYDLEVRVWVSNSTKIAVALVDISPIRSRDSDAQRSFPSEAQMQVPQIPFQSPFPASGEPGIPPKLATIRSRGSLQ